MADGLKDWLVFEWWLHVERDGGKEVEGNKTDTLKKEAQLSLFHMHRINIKCVSLSDQISLDLFYD